MTKFYESKNPKKLTDKDFKEISKKYDIPESRLRAVIEIEARGTGYYNNTGLLVALFEPHISYKYTSGTTRKKLVDSGLAYAKWVRNYPKTSYDRIDRTTKIAGEEVAALATSWGMPQMMGFNHDILGYDTALAMVKDFAISEANQVEGMMKFIVAKKLLTKLKNGDWKGFAYGYNGAGYAENSYDIKLAAADRKWAAKIENTDAKEVSSDLPVVPVLSKGSKGNAVKALQQGLKDLGYNITADGDFGGHTEEIVKQFQESHKLTVDGRAGPATRQKIADELNKKAKVVAQQKNVPLVFVSAPAASVLVGETAEKPVLAPQPELEKTVAKTNQFWLWISTLPLAGLMQYFNDWRILLALFGGIIVLAILGILAQNKLIETYKNIKKVLKEVNDV